MLAKSRILTAGQRKIASWARSTTNGSAIKKTTGIEEVQGVMTQAGDETPGGT
jgi:hypothetical protein